MPRTKSTVVTLLLAVPAAALAGAAEPIDRFTPPTRNRLQEVDPLIGTAGSDTLPVVTRPFGFTQWPPVTPGPPRQRLYG
jgi:putative alpha-1,2-mannosidase